MRARGTGRVLHSTYRDRETGERRAAATFTIRYYDRTTSAHVTEGGFKSEAAAERALRQRLTDQDQGKGSGRAFDRTTFEDLAELIERDYIVNRRDTLAKVQQIFKHLKRAFGGFHAVAITQDKVAAYTRRRLAEGAAVGIVNREFAALKRSFRLAEHMGKVAGVPHFKLLREDNVRKGFLDRAAFEAVRDRAPAHLQPVLTVAYLTGWRVRSEILTRQWRHVDLTDGWLRLEPGETKNGEGRMFPFIPELRAVLEAQRVATDALEEELGRDVPWVFHDQRGHPIGDFRKRWKAACIAAGFGTERRDARGRLLSRDAQFLAHDMRRSAVRNMERAGVPRSTAMALVGHRTEAVYRRYAIADEASLREGVARLAHPVPTPTTSQPANEQRKGDALESNKQHGGQSRKSSGRIPKP
jgi:integrase